MIEVYKYTYGLYKVSALPVEVEENTMRGHNYTLKCRLTHLNPALTCAGRT